MIAYVAAKSLEGRKSMFLELAPFIECKDELHLDGFFQDIIDKGGEGVILRDPASPYEPGRSRGYLKHKVRTSSVQPIYIHQSFNRNLGMQKRE